MNRYVLNTVLIVAFVFEAMTGCLRYYLDMFSLGLLLYVPKILMFVIPFFYFYFKMSKKIFFLVLVVIWSVCYSYAQSTKVTAILFSIYSLAPFLFGIVYIQWNDKKNIFFILFMLLYLITNIGIYIDFFYDLPWEGYSQSIGGISIEASRQWGTGGIPRLAGFARLSTAAAFFVAISSVFVIHFSKINSLKFFIFFNTVFVILLTTNKSTLMAYLLTSPFFFKFFRRYFYTVGILTVSSLGLIIPFYAIFHGIHLNLSDPIDIVLLASFEDRLMNTWPNVYNAIEYVSPTSSILGLGLGGFGTAARLFGNEILGVADNTWLYIYGVQGILGIVLLLFIALKACKLQQRAKSELIPFLISFNLLLWIGISTDIFESLISMFILGYIFYAKYEKVSYAYN